MAGDKFEFRRSASLLCQHFDRTPSQTVIAAKRISIADNEDSWHCSGTNHFIYDFPIRRQELYAQGHLPHGMSGTTQAWIVGAYHSLDTVQHSGQQFISANKMLCH